MSGDYSQSKIYIIRSNKTDNVYVGSTIQPLKERFYNHKSDYNSFIKGSLQRPVSSFEIMKYEDAFIELLEEYSCENKEQLYKKEGEWIQKTQNCINKRIAGQTKKEYREKPENIEKRKEYLKLFRQENKEKISKYFAEHNKKPEIKERRKQYLKIYRAKPENKQKEKEHSYEVIECPCGSSVTRGALFNHKKTQKHISFIQNLSTSPQEKKPENFHIQNPNVPIDIVVK